jgi:hypothetical protein
LWIWVATLASTTKQKAGYSGKAKLLQNRMKGKLFFITWYKENRVI